MAIAPLIRKAEEGDIPALLSLYTHLDPKDSRPSDEDAVRAFRRFHLTPGSAILLAEDNGVMVGSCALAVIANLTRGARPFGLIENVVTHADYRGRGVGKTLLHAAVERAWDADCYKVMLLTGSTRPETIAFYETAGFEQSKTGFQVRRHPKRVE